MKVRALNVRPCVNGSLTIDVPSCSTIWEIESKRELAACEEIVCLALQFGKQLIVQAWGDDSFL